MAHQPAPFRPSREEQESVTGSHPPARSFQLAESARVSLSRGNGLDVLREEARTDGLDLDAFLDEIVNHARALTGSNGAAVALRHGTVFLCRARCGETSPSLGAQVDADFGISGECLRTGKSLHCEDSERDLRLDPEVCRQLGLRSIAVVPIFESNEAAGILEVFASKPHAFDNRHLEILQQLAELVTTVTGRVTQNNQDAIAEAVLRPGSKEQPEIRTSQVKSYASPSRSERLRKWMASIALRDLLAKRLTKWTAPVASPRYYAAAIAVFALAGLLTILSWKPWHRTERSVVPSTKILPQAQPVPADAATIETRRQLNIVEPGAVSRSVRPQPAASPIRSDHSSKGPAQKVALVEPVSGEDDVKATITVPSLSGQTRGSLGSANDREPQAQAPSIGTAGGFGKDKDKDVNVLDSALSVRATLPFMASQGVSGGTLEREVQPIYPAQARSERLQGPVVLRALIDEGGEVRNLKTVSGDAVLAQAAIEAVHQWHYQPYLLNGQPVKMPIQITVNFTLP